jgi:hypothetical protein
MILLASLFGTPLQLFGTEPNQELIFRSTMTDTFTNTETWVTMAFTDFFNECWGPNWWTDGRQIDRVEAIVQTQDPTTEVDANSNTGGAYGWHIRFKDTAGDLRHQSFFYKPTEFEAWGTTAHSGCQTRKNFLMGYDNSGPDAVGQADGTFKPFETDEDDDDVVAPCEDSNATVSTDGSCGPCKSGYEDLYDGNGCVEITDGDDEDEDDDRNKTIKYIGMGGAGLIALIVLSKVVG